jgi:hypothetical protein
LSVAIVGAILAPIATGSLKKADRESWGTEVEDDQSRYLVAHGASRGACFGEWLGQHFNTVPHYATESDRKLCEESRSLFGENAIDKVVYSRPNLVPVLRDILLRFFAPLIVVLVGPPMAAAYFRWVTKPPK